MSKKYTSSLTAKLTPDNWQEHINLADIDLDGLLDLLGDFKAMENFGKKLGGFLKEAVKARMPEGETEYTGKHFNVALNERSRIGNLDVDKCTAEMGETWVEEHRAPPSEYVEVRVTKVKEE